MFLFHQLSDAFSLKERKTYDDIKSIIVFEK
jgi:hypothetical protein